MKWTSLSWQQQNKLRDEYNQRHADAQPQPPEAFTPPEQQERKTINTGYKSDVYVRMSVPGSHRSGPGEANGQLRLVGSSEHIEVDLPLEAIPALFNQLAKLHQDMLAYVEAANAHRAAQKAYEENKEQYEAARDAALQEALKSGKYTEEDIVTNTDDIPF